MKSLPPTVSAVATTAATVAATAAVAALTIGITAPTATAGTGVHAEARAEANVSDKQLAAVKTVVVKKIARTNAALDGMQRAAERVDAEVRAEVRSNIEADQAALADLRAEARAAATVAAVREARQDVNDYRAAVYKKVVASLRTADRLDAKIEEAQAESSLDVTVTAGLQSAELHVNSAVDGALDVGAASERGELRAVRADLSAAASAYAEATE